MCDCEFTPDPDEPGEEPWHYLRTCPQPECGKEWWGLHCPHDGVQALCPHCHHMPKPASYAIEQLEKLVPPEWRITRGGRTI
jgi:hypothetical protein